MRVNTTDMQNAFGKYLSLVEKEDIIITKNGRSVAKLTHYKEPDYFIVHEEAHQYQTMKKVSYEEYMELVDSSDQRYELIEGEIYLLASPSFTHQVVVNEISWHFNNYFKGKPCRSLTAPLDIRLFGYATKFEEEPNVVQPDVVVICDEEKVNEKNKYEGIPTLIVEVLSPSTKNKDLVAKLNLYMKSGVSEYWVVNPENKSILQYSFSKEREIDYPQSHRLEDTIQSTVFPGLEIFVQDVFSEISL
ncbi:prevent-host-death family protein [Desulfitobacterium dichloroeliminans LMG P-21439]|uniref:Prevent-host-death family protein n=1 Tax=Desulfitobacterium dichloroeliminans (strain LMG P-21439 / DCA1) TaxID=871963 RepID=L0F4K3_DESDL|nr:type II toxin-antitoxin system prevent-host-death family antitoxin [Desulfitobacterium dichloroeliminans]AGA67873.1 prevent-host-death family protein [Desulfitobacterium dichloroeliminans LMG P-21439]